MSLQWEKYYHFMHVLRHLRTSEQNNSDRYILWGPHKENTDLKVPADICVILNVSHQWILRNFLFFVDVFIAGKINF